MIKVYDGDTITIASKLPYENSELYRFSVRLNGIDAPEIKGKTEDEKNAAHVSQKALEKLILHKNVILKNTNTTSIELRINNIGGHTTFELPTLNNYIRAINDILDKIQK